MKKRKALNSVVQSEQSVHIMRTLNSLVDWLDSFDITPQPFDRKQAKEHNYLNAVNSNCVLVFECVNPGLYVEDDIRFGICLLPTGIQIIMYPNDSASFGFGKPSNDLACLQRTILDSYIDVLKRWSKNQNKDVVISTVTKYRNIRGTEVEVKDGGTKTVNTMLLAAQELGLFSTETKQTLRTDEVVIWS